MAIKRERLRALKEKRAAKRSAKKGQKKSPANARG
jgi:hypothetical protein